jgi:hypothetical protein
MILQKILMATVFGIHWIVKEQLVQQVLPVLLDLRVPLEQME